ncbi:chloride channel protein [Geothrix oryzae]|uniref:Chloride channel protein n=1 Tax=Geothrix oryzae TaxID=2927975 RepID=A0ABM8DQ61_9BACT|nr:chloride channel protein [Geothrix oryzae]BDU69087.1 chloride channel protein [Geothrix oryzae]
MSDRAPSQGIHGDGLPVSPSLEPSLQNARIPLVTAVMDGRAAFIGLLAIGLGVAAGYLAELLVRLIGLVTNLAFHHQISTELTSPAGHHLGWQVIFVPVLGGILIGFLARYGSRAIRGHGIPEAMEQILLNESRIPARITLLKPLSAAIAIGTGGPFGAEGPIIATGGALGSLLGQLLPTTALERKTLLAAGAAAGMAATFGSPVSAVLLAVELLLFELRPRSIIPVALASVAATAVRYSLVGIRPVFPMPLLSTPNGLSLAIYIAIGAVVGVASVGVTRAVYWIEDGFEHLPIHWMWWPALGGLAVGGIGYFVPRTLGVGYDNIQAILSVQLVGSTLLMLCLAKFLSWAIALGSGTSGGTLAPLFTIGGALGGLLGGLVASLLPKVGVDPGICALVGMAAIFAGASRAMLASAVFAFEITLQPLGLLPLLGGCAAAYGISALMMRNSIMTEKLTRRGLRVPEEYSADFLDHILVKEAASREIVTLDAAQSLEATRRWLEAGADGSTHHGFPVVEGDGTVIGVLTRRDLLESSCSPESALRNLLHRELAVAFEGNSIREAANHMVREGVGRLPVLDEDAKLVGILTRSDLLEAHASRLRSAERTERTFKPRWGAGEPEAPECP